VAQQAAERMQGEFRLPRHAGVDAVGFGRSGEENDAALVQALMRQLAKLLTGTSVLGIDHFGKAAETGTRGSSAKEGAADTGAGAARRMAQSAECPRGGTSS
jgi:hypothetical protein